MRSIIIATLACVAATSLAPPTLAQGPINRRIETVSITPAAAGGHDVHVIWTIEGVSTSVGLDASTGFFLFIGDNAEVPAASLPIQVQLDLVTGLCGFGGCASNCGSGYIDGVFNTMLCLQDGPCGGGGCDCSCRFPYITSTFPGVDIEPGDEIFISLFAMPGAFAEMDQSDDAFAIEVPERPLFWDRSISSVNVVPSPVAPGKVDVVVQGLAQWRLPGVPADMSFELQIIVNHALLASTTIDGFAGPPGPGESGCDGSPSICSNNCGTWNASPTSCDTWITYPSYLISCECGTPWIQSFASLPANPGDEIMVLIVPTQSSLPALPGSGDDDEVMIVVPSACVGDLNGDGVVDGADLGMVLASWGQGGPADLNGDGTVDGGDLGLLLNNWGPCDPV